ncbi:hypothetical protein [Sansalvadorimonas verongulae]|uniref:hypothetical protein n=1 Tax=Sansalvadorimonas verongulae TaxID=2172824 RepID=UPI0012BD2399|nr:hypothetical protein [Sansalvadorimonas verongulae]MTI15215.1 hypothetical protein [Sansalvadorimonas verongulae]
MAFYMITYGLYQITDAYIGLSEEETIQSARPLIDQWPEYADMEDEGILDWLRADQCEFDMVQIRSQWPGEGISLDEMIQLYDNNSVPARTYLKDNHTS